VRRIACLLLLAGGVRGEGDETAALVRDTETLLAELDAEVQARREGGRGAEAEALAREVDALRRSAEKGAQPVPSTLPEVHVVQLLERRRFRTQERASIHVTVVGRPLILVLVGATPTWWDVEVARGVDVRRVLRFPSQTVRGIRVPAEQIADAALLDTDPSVVGAAIEATVGARLATVLQVAGAAGDTAVLGPGNPEWQAQHVHVDALDLYWRSTRARRAAQREDMKKLRFGAVYRWQENGRLGVSFGEWTPVGPLLARQHRLPDVLAIASTAVLDEERSEIYLLREGVLIRYALPKGPPEVLRVPDTLPQVREPCALAIDTLRHRLLLATKYEHGYLYALDLKSREWSVVNDLQDVDAAGMAYDAQRDAILCIEYGAGGGLVLHRFSPEDGLRVHTTMLRAPPLRDARPLAAACVGGRLVILYPPAEALAQRAGLDSRAFVVEPHTGEVLFSTRVRPWEDFEPLPEARLEELWNEMAAKEDALAARAMRLLAGQGDAAVRFLAKRFAPEAGAVEDLRRWVAMLSDDHAFVRDLAQYRIVEAGSKAEEFLASIDLATLEPEARRRVEAALKAVAAPGRSERNLRAVHVLEWIETPAAETLLGDLATQGNTRRAAAAREALERMKGPRR